MNVPTCLKVSALATLVALVALGARPVAAQEPPPPPPPPAPEEEVKPEEPEAEEAAAKEEQAGEQAKEEEFKEEEPATPAEKMKKEELEKRACPSVDVKFKTETDKKSHPLGEAPSDKALVYVVRPTMYGNKIQSKLAVNGTWMGVNRGHNYFFFTLDPGEHYLCSKAENKSVMALKVEAGKTYFVEQKIKMGFMKARNKIELIPEEEGKKKLAKSHPSSWAEKK
jgi:hypothetical protein